MNNRQKRGIIMTILGLAMVLASMGMHLTRERQDVLAGESTQILLQQMELNKTVSAALPDLTVPNENTSVSAVMPEKEYLGYSIIGTLRISSVGIELPIMSSWSYELLEVAPCRYSGSVLTENMILMGHNYTSHFMPLHDVKIGALVEFEDVNGVVYRYKVSKLESLHRSNIDKLEDDFPLTLFTCTLGGINRVVIRCENTDN